MNESSFHIKIIDQGWMSGCPAEEDLYSHGHIRLMIGDKIVSDESENYVIVDNYSTHKHPKVKRWLAAHPRWHVHYTPTYASWLNQVEIWFNIVTQKAIRRGSFTSVKELVANIDNYVTHYNRHRKPFMWTATADSILAKIERLCQAISETRH